MLIDTHAHLFWDSFQADYEDIIERSIKTGLTHIINVGVDVETSQKAAKLESSQLKFFSSIGIHPHEAIKYFENPDVSIQQDIDRLEEIYLANISKVVAIGECGLDYLFSSNELPTTLPENQIKSLQIRLFQAQVELAKKLNLPLLIHCRDDRSKNPENSEAWDTVLKIINDHPAILHCYSGLSKTTNQALSQTNLLFSFAGNITYPKNEYLKEAVKIIPLDRIVVETDCPFLPPQTHRGQKNEPSFITETVQTIADIKQISFEEVTQQTTQNASKIGLLRV